MLIGTSSSHASPCACSSPMATCSSSIILSKTLTSEPFSSTTMPTTCRIIHGCTIPMLDTLGGDLPPRTARFSMPPSRSIIAFTKNKWLFPTRNPSDRRIKQRMSEGHAGRMPYSWFYYDLVKNVSKDKTFHACQIPLDLVRMLVAASTQKE